MEGIALATELIGTVAYMGGVALLAFVASGVLFGYMAEEEHKGNRLFWAEWPISGTGEPASHHVEREYLKAA